MLKAYVVLCCAVLETLEHTEHAKVKLAKCWMSNKTDIHDTVTAFWFGALTIHAFSLHFEQYPRSDSKKNSRK